MCAEWRLPCSSHTACSTASSKSFALTTPRIGIISSVAISGCSFGPSNTMHGYLQEHLLLIMESNVLASSNVHLRFSLPPARTTAVSLSALLLKQGNSHSHLQIMHKLICNRSNCYVFPYLRYMEGCYRMYIRLRYPEQLFLHLLSHLQLPRISCASADSTFSRGKDCCYNARTACCCDKRDIFMFHHNIACL